MTAREFNSKWGAYLEERFYGMTIDHPQAIEYLDKEFAKEVELNPSFSYSQIKMKFDTVCVYANSDKTSVWEKELNKIL